MNIYQKMLAATKEIATVAKNLDVDTGKGKGYKAVGEADVLRAVKPIEEKYGIYSYPFSRSVIDSGELISQTQYGERRQLYMRVETIYRFVNTEEPSEFIDITTYGDGVDSQDKAPGKAMTYGDKYALLKAYKIQTGADPDAEPSQPLQAVTPMEKVANSTIGKIKVDILRDKCKKEGIPEEFICSLYKISTIEDMTEKMFSNANNNWAKVVAKANESKNS